MLLIRPCSSPDSDYVINAAFEAEHGRTRPIDIVITDLDMPNMGGIPLIQVLKQLTPELRIIVSSGLEGSANMSGRQNELQTLAASVILKKPYTVDEVLFAVHAALNS